MWRTGANANTTISFSEDVKVAGKDVKKGKYEKSDNSIFLFRNLNDLNVKIQIIF